MINSNFNARMDAGVDFLDATIGTHWPFAIDLGRFDMGGIDGAQVANGKACILCQLAKNSWHEALYAVNLNHAEAAPFAFECRDFDPPYEEMTRLWTERILSLRAERQGLTPLNERLAQQ